MCEPPPRRDRGATLQQARAELDRERAGIVRRRQRDLAGDHQQRAATLAEPACIAVAGGAAEVARAQEVQRLEFKV